MDVSLIAITAAVLLVAGLVKGVIGLGLPTVSLALLSVVLDLPTAVKLMVIPSAFTNLWQAVDGTALPMLTKRFWPMLVANCIGVWVAYELFFVWNPELMTGVLGVVLCLYALWSFAPTPKIEVKRESLISPVIGLLTGVLAGATGSMVMPVVDYLRCLALDRVAIVQMMGLSFSVSTIAIGIALAGHGHYQGTLLAVSAAAIVPAVVGMKVGAMVRNRLSEAAFKHCLNIGLLLVGGHLIIKGF